MATTDANRGTDDGRPESESRRRFVRKAAYVAPLLLTFRTRLAAAQVGSGPVFDDS